MAVTVTPEMRTQVSQLYVALFGRAPDSEGLGYWVQQVANGASIATVADAMYGTTPARTYYPLYLTPEEIVTKFYQNVLGRNPDTDGKTYWTGELQKTDATPGSVIAKMISVVANYDTTQTSTDPVVQAGIASAKLFNNKVAVAEYFATKVGTVAGSTDVLATVTADPATVTAAKAVVDGVGVPGQTFTLTVNQDAPGALSPARDTQGTSGNDTYVGVVDTTTAANTTLQATDSIDGGAGVDTLQIIGSGVAANSVTPLFIKNVERVSVKDIEATNGTTVNLVNVAGVTEVINDASVGAVVFDNIGTAAVTVKGVATAATTTFSRGTSPVTSALTINVEDHGKLAAVGSAAVTGGAINSNDGNNDATSVTINAKGAVRIDTMNVTGTSVVGTHTATSVTLNAAGETTFVGATGITGFDTTKAGVLTVTGAGKVDLNGLAGAVKTLDASANTGGVTAVGAQYTGTDATAAAAPGLKMTGGSGNDTFTFNGVASADVSLGAGNDTAIVTGALTAGVKIAGGEGTDTLVLTQAAITSLNATTTAANNIRAGITGFEVLGISDTLATAFNVNTVGAYNTLQVRGDVGDGGAGTSVAVTGFTDGATVEFRASPTAGPLTPFVQEDILSVGMTGAALNTNATLNLNLNANLLAPASAANSIQATYKVGVDSINIINVKANDRVNDVTDDNATLKDNSANIGYALELSTATNLRTVNIEGSSLVSYTTGAANALQTINASASTGNLVVDASGFAGTERLTITGSQGQNTITGSDTTFGDAIIGGAKNDNITGGQGADAITGGGGRDIFVVVNGDSNATLTSVSGIDKISDFGKVTVAGTSNTVATFQDVGAVGGENADLLDLTGVPTLAASAAITAFTAGNLTAIAGATGSDVLVTDDIKFAVNAKGQITLSGAQAAKIDTLVEWVAVADILTTAAGGASAFEFNGNTYVFQEVGATDTLIELTGVTGFGATNGLVVAGGAAAVGDILIG